MKQFEKIRLQKPKSSVFDLSHEKKLTCNMGELVPILCEETLPGDKFRINTEILMRFQPLISPMMHRVNVYTHFFFVPYRLIWNEWEQFITGGEDGKASPVYPTFEGELQYAQVNIPNVFAQGSLMDHFGIPVNTFIGSSKDQRKLSLLPFRAYQLIYNEYYRDQNLQQPVVFTRASGAFKYQDNETELTALLQIRMRAWEKDYFTSALPWAQRGDQVLLPLQGSAPVSGELRWRLDSTAPMPDPNTSVGVTQIDGTTQANLVYDSGGLILRGVDPRPLSSDPLSADLSEASSTTITELRRAYALQRWLEKMARGGSRYVEQMLHMFGVKSSDARLQRPEYLGGGKLPVQISEVLQTSRTDDNETPQGNMAGHGFTAGVNNGFTKYFEEHGLVIGIMSVMPRTAYMQGMPKMLLKNDRFDYFFPEFAHIGEQEVKTHELFYDPEINENDSDFGYQRRYAEYTTRNDQVAGDMRTTLKHWHMAREFSNKPLLNSAFVTSNPDTRIFAVTDPQWHKLICQLYFDFKAIRPIPKYGEPI